MSKKLPAFQFYPGDWMKDPALRSVSLSARGLWTDLLCLMHQSDRRGYLQHATGKPWTLEQIARATGCSTAEVSRLLQELEDSGVFSCTEHSVLYSRRMVRDERKRRACAEAGKKGGGNPTLRQRQQSGTQTKELSPTFKGQSKGGVKGGFKQKPNPSSSSSISSDSVAEASPPSHSEENKFVQQTTLSPPNQSVPVDPIAIWQEVFSTDPPIFQIEVIERANITDLDLWRETLQCWRDNRYSLRNISGIIDSYKRRSERTAKIIEHPSSKPKKQFCGSCNSGWLPPDHGEIYAKECECVVEIGRVAV